MTPPRFLSVALTVLAVLALSSGARAGTLRDEIGRSEVRVRSAVVRVAPGRTIHELALVSRLEHLGYERVHAVPATPGEFFWGHETFWIFRRACRHGGRDRQARLFGLSLRRSDGRILGVLDAEGRAVAEDVAWLDPEVLTESLDGSRAPRRSISFSALPEVTWRPLLAAEDARFFDHGGLDARGIARALLANIKAGGVAQGGSTITQQLVKMRDLTPKRTLGRKVSEALRALAIEAEHDKDEILEAYLDHVYYGHVDGIAIHGIGQAAHVFFSKDPADLDLGQAALLAAVIQGPNALSPIRHPKRARERRDWVLGRMAELGWSPAADVAAARAEPVALRRSPPDRPLASQFLAWVASIVEDEAPERLDKGRGVVVETTIDPHLQRMAERVVAARLARLRRDYPLLARTSLDAALVALDADTGDVLAHVGGDPRGRRGGFDLVRQARRQPGSTVKPLVLLEAFDDCGARAPLSPASRVLDEPLRLDLQSGAWEPANHDQIFRGVLTVREALVDSVNVPFVRVASWCGFDETGARMRRAGLPVPSDAPPSLALGAIEVSPLALASAYTVLATPGRRLEPRPVVRVERPGGRAIARERSVGTRVAEPAAAWLVRDVLRSAVAEGTARAAGIEGVNVAAKTGTSSERRDAWLAGHAEGVVTVVWVGLEEGGRLGLTGAVAAGPIWREFMAEAVKARPFRSLEVPAEVVERRYDPRSGLLVRRGSRRGEPELFLRSNLPRSRRFWRRDEPEPIVR